jgi:hypothetical protein
LNWVTDNGCIGDPFSSLLLIWVVLEDWEQIVLSDDPFFAAEIHHWMEEKAGADQLCGQPTG